MKTMRPGWVLAGVLCGALLPAAAHADTPAGAEALLGAAVSDADLAEMNGRQGVSMIGIGAADGIVSDNVISGRHIETGANTIAGEAFHSVAGIANVLMNSGNHVVMNNLMIVNIHLD